MAASPSAVSFKEALRYWIKLGFINFGGPAGQIAIMHKDLVDRRRWISEHDFLRALNFCMILPGPEAQQLATYIGWRLHGVWGGIMAGVWFILPSVFIILALSWLLAAHRDLTLVSGVLYGVQPVIVAIVAEAVIRLGRRYLRHWVLLLIAAAAFVSIYFLRVPFPVIVVTAGLFGLVLGRWRPLVFRPQGHGADAHAEGTTAASPPHFPPLSRLVKVIAIFLPFWAVPFGILVLWRGFASVYTDMALFFTGAAFVTFGGAYAVLSYIAEAGVNVYGWLEPGEMVSGLALAESTPGPLIMVLQYVGFMGGWRFHGDLSPFWSGTLASAVTTYVTFLPCFLFIFAGAPYIEALAGNRRLQAALVGVTAAIVGVILNLAVFFASHVLFTDEWRPDVFAVVLAVLAFGALQRLHWQIHSVVGLGAAIGLVWVFGRTTFGL
jgi:chromate transporter